MLTSDRGRDALTCGGDSQGPPQYIVNETTLIVRFRKLQDYSCGGDSLGVRHRKLDTTTPVISIIPTHYMLSVSVSETGC